MGNRAYELPFEINKYGIEDRYYATKHGKIYYGRECNGVEEVNLYIKNGMKYVMIYNKEYYLAKVLLIAWVGDIELPIICNNEKNPTSKNTLYDLGSGVRKINNHYFIGNSKFKEILNFKRYFISDNGIVFDSYKMRFLNHKLNNDGYHVVRLCDDIGRCKTKYVHRLVYQTWVGEIPEGMELDHIYSKAKNGICDIEPVTHLENIRRAHKAGYYSDHTKEDVIEICDLLQSGMRPYEICKKKGFHNGDSDYCRMLSFIYSIRNGETWNDISKNYKFPPTNIYGGRVHSDEKIHEICRLLESGYSQKEIEHMTGVKCQYVSNIRQGKVRRNISKKYDFSNCRKRGNRKLFNIRQE